MNYSFDVTTCDEIEGFAEFCENQHVNVYDLIAEYNSNLTDISDLQSKLENLQEIEDETDEFDYSEDDYQEEIDSLETSNDAIESALQDQFNNFEDAYIGEFGTHAEFCFNLFSDHTWFNMMPNYIADSISWYEVFETTLCHDYWCENNYYFRNI